MHELARAWTEKRGLILIAVSAFIYALVLIPFNQVNWVISGISIRPAAALPVVLGILWGPAVHGVSASVTSPGTFSAHGP